MNKHGVSRRWSTEADAKNFKSDALRTIAEKCKVLHRYFLRILLIDSELPAIKMDFFEVAFENFVQKLQNSYQPKNWTI